MATRFDHERLNLSFQEDGFVVMKGFFDSPKVVEINQRIQRFIDEILPGLPDVAFYEDLSDASTIMRLQGMENHDPYFSELYDHPDFAAVAKTFMQDDINPQTAQWFAKPARVGNETPPHQDGYYFKLNPNEAVTCWLALDQVDEENGCIRFVRGSHRRGMRPHQLSNVMGFSQGINDYGDNDRALEVPILLEPGDVTAHHSMTIHRADPNHSERPRRALGFVFYAARAEKDLQQSEEQRREVYQTWKREGKV